MNIKELNDREEMATDNKLKMIYSELTELLNELKSKELKQSVVAFINDSGKRLIKLVLEKQAAILHQVEKEHKIVQKNRYRNTWIFLGMTLIGVPIGAALGLSIGNIGLLGLGFPVGIAIGLLIGISLDKKALRDGRQLKTEIKNFLR
jgi:geranylgeranyl pyrophosphate synthase